MTTKHIVLLVSGAFLAYTGANTEAATASTTEPYPTFESRDAFLAYVKRAGTRFLDLGASRGGSRKRLLSWVRRAEPSTTHRATSSVLGLDINFKLNKFTRSQFRAYKAVRHAPMLHEVAVSTFV